jgi:hypothetical protein
MVGELFESEGLDDDVVDPRVLEGVDCVIDVIVGMVWLSILDPASVKL